MSANRSIETKVIYSNGGTGRVDVLDKKTGEIWEIKHHNAKNPAATRAKARSQLRRYTGATVADSGLNVQAPLHPSSRKYEGKIESVSVFLIGDVEVDYWSYEPGIVEYAFRQAEQEPAREQVRENSPAEVKVPRGVPIIPPIGINPPERQGGAAPGFATGYSPGYGFSMGGGGRWWNTMAFRMF